MTPRGDATASSNFRVGSGLRIYDFFFRAVRLRGTFPPALRASDNPIAIACLRLFTLFPERPLRSFPDLRSCIARFTF